MAIRPSLMLFRRGHRIRVHLSGSRFPLWDRNTSTGNDPALDTETVLARQTDFHDAERPTHIVLPLIPTSSLER